MHAAGSGTVFALLAQAPEDRDLGLSRAAREAVIAAITSESAVVDAGTGARRSRCAPRSRTRPR